MKLAATANACRLLGEVSDKHVAPQLGSFFGCETIPRSLPTELARVQPVTPVDGSVTEVPWAEAGDPDFRCFRN